MLPLYKIYIFISYVLNPTIVIQTFFRLCDKKVCIAHDTENGTTFSVFLQEYLGFLQHINE